jgi:parvulin-like peptidyl-prolyl isomerase
MFKDAGYTYEEGREQLSVVNTVNSMLDYKVRSQLIIPEKQAREYYADHPVYQEDRYKLKRIHIPFDQENEAELKQKIMQKLKMGQKIVGAGASSTEFWVEGPDLAAEKNFIKEMEVGQISTPERLEDGFEMFELLEKKDRELVSFEEQYNEIANVLRKPMYEQLFEDYKKSLYDNAVIVNF